MSHSILIPLIGLVLVALPGHALAQVDVDTDDLVTNEEAGAGAAAVSIVALRCRPAVFAAIKKAAFEHLADRLRGYPADERERVMDAAERKLRALTVASEKTDCAGLANLRLMARTWGYANLLAER